MKYLKLLSILIALSLISCDKEVEVEEPDENATVIAMLEVRSTSRIPKDVTKVRLTELLKDSYVEIIPEANRPDTTKAVLSIPYKKVPKEFSALVSVYHKDGRVVETKVPNIELLEGKKTTCFADMFKVGFTIGWNDEWLADSTIVYF